ncbi:MAG: c-type cytochrome [Candidatus Promineofilum sp.]|nr:c-type cytochrome [Promineifilum sp.]
MTRTAVGLLALAGLLLAASFASWAGRPSPGVAVAQDAATATRTPAAVGRTLFAIKGCASCHRHDGLTGERLTHNGRVMSESESIASTTGAPDLTRYEPDPDFVRAWLRDPGAVRPGTGMPNLGLSEEEIEALLAFLEE